MKYLIIAWDFIVWYIEEHKMWLCFLASFPFLTFLGKKTKLNDLSPNKFQFFWPLILVSQTSFSSFPLFSKQVTHTHNVESIVAALARTTHKHSSINVTNLFAFSSPNIFLLLQFHKPNYQHFTKTIISDNKLSTLTQRRDCCEKTNRNFIQYFPHTFGKREE